MAHWTSLVVLSALAVITLGFPRADDRAYNIPTVGTGQRSQYHVSHSDGTFKYGYDTGDGAFESAKLKGDGQLDGQFGYTDPDGNDVRLEYESGTSGFVASGTHIPQPPAEVAQAIAAARTRTTPFVDPLATQDSDASFGFGFKDEVYSRTEEADDDGTVRGSYTYTDEDGVTRTYNYRAGSGIGFVIEGNDFVQSGNGESPASTRLTGSASRTRLSSTSSSGTGSSSGFSGTRASTSSSGYSGTRSSGASNQYSGPSKHKTSAAFNSVTVNRPSTIKRPSPPVRQPSLPSRPLGAAVRASSSSFGGGITSNSGRNDASYSFSYATDDHSRSESADSNLNVDGSFSFTADDGVQRTVNYAAGSGTGFTAQGSHLPVAPKADFGNRASSSPNRRTSTSFTGHSGSSVRKPSTSYTSSNIHTPSSTRQSSSQRTTSFTHQSPSVHRTSNRQSTIASRPSTSFTSQNVGQTYYRPSSTSSSSVTRTSSSNQNRPFEEANVRSTQSIDGSYEFNYQTSSHSRSESGDSDNNVEGEFAFVADDDQQNREIKYEAGSDTGFIAEGAHIPVGPEVPGAPSGQPTGAFARTQRKDFVDPLADTASDSSYDFGFQDETYSRTEEANEDGTVSGSYTYTDEDGITRTYRYRAGKGIGFVIEGTDFARSDDGESPASTTLTGSSSISSLSSTRLTGSSNQNRVSTGSRFSATSSSGSSSHSSSAGNRFASTSSVGGGYSGSSVRKTGSGLRPSTSVGGGFSGSSIRKTGSGLRPSTSFRPPSPSANTSVRGSSPANPLRRPFTPSSTSEVFPGFTLHQYDQSNSPDKFGYVLKFD